MSPLIARRWSDRPLTLKAVKPLGPLQADKQTFDAGQDDQRQTRCQTHHRQGNPNWIGFRDGIDQAKQGEDDRHHDHQREISRSIIDACVVKLLPANVACVSDLDVTKEDFATSTRWAFKLETSENCLSRIAFRVFGHDGIHFTRVGLHGKSRCLSHWHRSLRRTMPMPPGFGCAAK